MLDKSAKYSQSIVYPRVITLVTPPKNTRQGQQLAANPTTAAVASGLRLPQFWTDAPNSWFSMAEAQFRLRGVVNNADKYCHLLAALLHEAFPMVAHIVERDQEEEAAEEYLYAQLKAALVSSHVLSNYRWIELLSTVEPLGGRRPSELLASMLELCPRGEETSPFFCYLFLGNHRRTAHKKKKAKKGGSSNNNNGGDKQGLFYFHNKFGECAHRCEEPCSWPENE
jgi:hypothetical protein